MLFETIQHTFKHQWQDISLASWRKYPCENRPDVLAVDLIERHYNSETGVLTAKRLVTMKALQLPTWLSSIVCSPVVYCLEESTIDPRNRRMELRSRNLSLQALMEVTEVCCYTVEKSRSDWTDFQQDATITAFPFGLQKRLESWSLANFQQNALKGQEVMELAIARIKREAEELARDLSLSASSASTALSLSVSSATVALRNS